MLKFSKKVTFEENMLMNFKTQKENSPVRVHMLGNLTSSIIKSQAPYVFKGEIIQIIASQSIFYDQYHTNEGRGCLSTPNILLLQIHNMRGAWQILNEVIKASSSIEGVSSIHFYWAP